MNHAETTASVRPVARFLDRVIYVSLLTTMTAIRPIDDYLELMASGGLIGCALVARFGLSFVKNKRKRL